MGSQHAVPIFDLGEKLLPIVGAQQQRDTIQVGGHVHDMVLSGDGHRLAISFSSMSHCSL